MLVKPPVHRFLLKGFQQTQQGRNFLFEGIDDDNSRTEIAVYADLALSRGYGIRLQELPLLCLELLERRAIGIVNDAIVFTEQEMSRVSSDRKAAQAAAAQKRKIPRRRPVENPGAGWRPLGPLTMPIGK